MEDPFDLTLIVTGAVSASVASASLDGADFPAALDTRAVEGSLDSVPGVTLRCPLDEPLRVVQSKDSDVHRNAPREAG